MAGIWKLNAKWIKIKQTRAKKKKEKNIGIRKAVHFDWTAITFLRQV